MDWNVGLAPLTGRTRQPFRLLDLPPEIRKIIYDLWGPAAAVYVSLSGSQGVRLQHVVETSAGLSVQTISPQAFVVNREVFHEFCYALFARSTWCFSSVDLLPQVLSRLSGPARDRIQRVSVRFVTHGTRQDPLRAGSLRDGTPMNAFRLAERPLRQLNQLQTLVVNTSLADFRFLDPHPTEENANKLAANCVAGCTWDGVQIRIPFAESNLPTLFTETLIQRCGEAHVSLVRKHKDRYAGQLIDVVISQRAAIDQPGLT